MSRRKAADAAFAKALALWEPPEGAGEARVCIASTYTFNAAFFEAECLGRFLGMDAHPAESDAVSYMVEREEKLAAARVAVLADRRNACDKESLRWDVLGILVPDAIQHSKISLLAWANHVRVIVGSGNLTEPGYRKNLEVFGALNLSRREGGAREALTRVIDFLAETVNSAVGTDAPGAPKARAREALSSVRTLIGRWTEIPARNPVLILGGPGRSILSQLAEAWPSGSPPRTAYVVSPFFDSDGKDAASALLGVLAKRRPREIFFDVRTESGPEGRTRVFAPLPMVQHAAAQAEVTVRRVLPEQRGELRDLHAKMIYLNNDDWRLVMAGSSNFTRAGLGAGGHANFEANLAYRLRASDSDAKVLDGVWPEVDEEEPLDIESGALIWDPRSEEDEDGAGGVLPLPAGFEEASFVPGSPASLVLMLRAPLPKSWSIQADGGRELVSSARRVGPGEQVIPWQGPDIPFVLQVTWTHKSGSAAASWPVNVSNPAALPPPEALRSLTLEELLQVLASTRPIPQAVAEVLAKRKHKKGDGSDELDPLKRFDSQSFLLRRTKRLATALERLRERLERPTSSRQAFEWRLFGPVGPLALADGYLREARFAGEAKFCLAEIALVLHRVQLDHVAADGLPRAAVAESLKQAIERLAERAATIPQVPAIDRYAEAAFKEAVR
jgi:hypothetical protein